MNMKFTLLALLVSALMLASPLAASAHGAHDAHDHTAEIEAVVAKKLKAFGAQVVSPKALQESTQALEGRLASLEAKLAKFEGLLTKVANSVEAAADKSSEALKAADEASASASRAQREVEDAGKVAKEAQKIATDALYSAAHARTIAAESGFRLPKISLETFDVRTWDWAAIQQNAQVAVAHGKDLTIAAWNNAQPAIATAATEVRKHSLVLAEQGKVFAAAAADKAQVLAAVAQKDLTAFLKANGVPPAHAPTAATAIVALAAFIASVVVFLVLRLVIRLVFGLLCCCRSRKPKKAAAAAAAVNAPAPAGKGKTPTVKQTEK